MLVDLRVSALGVVDDVTLSFGPGLTVLTGETGAGKTLLVEALAAVLGRRVGPGVVRDGAFEALVEARFETGGRPGHEVVLARTLLAAGRGRAYVDGRMATVATLAERGAALIDIHGQHDQHSLLSARGQRRALDSFAGIDDAPFRAARRRLRHLEQALDQGPGSLADLEARRSLLRYQAEEIAAARLADPEEDEKLRAEEDRLANVAAHRRAALEAVAALEGIEGSEAGGAVDIIGRASNALRLMSGGEAWLSRLQGIAAELTELAREVRATADALEEDPEALATLQERRRVLAGLRRKYGASLAEVMAFGEQVAHQLDELQGVEASRAALERERAAAQAEVERLASEVAGARRSGAPRLARAVTGRLGDLALGGARLEVEVAGEGGEEVSLLLAANPGEGPRPLAQVASGGELARTTLALRLVAPGGPETVVFDEVDAGVGGQAALALAAALAELAGERQVLAVTHLPQVAAFADRHVVVRKRVTKGRTVAEATPVEGAERVVELSRMLSGHPDSRTARAHAAELLKRARKDAAGKARRISV